MAVKIKRAPYKVTFSTRLDEEVYDALTKASFETKATMTEILDAALRKHLKLEKAQ